MLILQNLSKILIVTAMSTALYGEQKGVTKTVVNDDPNSLDGRIPVGYWDFSKPETRPEAFADPEWNESEEQRMVLEYLGIVNQREFGNHDDDEEATGNDLFPRELQRWRGLHFCEFCGAVTGNSCHGDAQYNWPEGYAHYITDHHMKPPATFVTHALTQLALYREQQQQKRIQNQLQQAEGTFTMDALTDERPRPADEEL